MVAFEFATASRIVFGPGKVQEVGRLAAQMIPGPYRRALVTTGAGQERAEGLLESLRSAGFTTAVFPISGEPTVDLAQQGAEVASQEGATLVVGFGGGSAVDTAKAIAALVTNRGDVFDYLEVVGRGQPLLEAPLPVIAIPTTAGTGSEVTRNAVLGVPERQVKVSLRSPGMLPRLAIIDPELTYSLPPEVTASTGMDALTQLIEPYVSNAANPLTDGLCREGMQRSARSLLRAVRDGGDRQAREDLAVASLLGGLALANARLGAAHGFAGPLGGMFPAPHGAVCAALIPHVVAENIAALRRREPDNPALGRYAEVARLLTGSPEAAPEEAAGWLAELVRDLNIPHLAAYGVSPDDFPLLVEKAAAASSMKGNPIRLTEEELANILARAV